MRGDVRFDGFTWRPLGRREAVVAGLDLTIGAGERVLLVGPSGSGKSTMLLALAGALGTTIAGELTGSATVDGRIGLLLQNPADAVVAEHIGRDVAFGLENLRVGRDEIWRRVDDALEAVGLGQGRGHPTGALSGGEQQRLALAGVLALQPDVMLLDEPTAMLDAATAATVRDAIVSASRGRTMVVVEHRIGPWLEHVDRVIVLSADGRVVADGDVASFVAGSPPPGVWAPGMTVPVPLAVPATLVAPVGPTPEIVLEDVAVDLVLRTLRGVRRTRALQGLDATVLPGHVSAFTGPSGAGKSTAVGVVAGLIKISEGSVTPDLRSMRSRALAAIAGWVPQNPEHGFLTRTVADEVAHTSRRLGREADVAAILDVFGLGRFAPSNPYRLSGGEQRRLAIAAGLAHRPGLVLLDEPTVGQDPSTWAAVAGWIEASRDAGATVVVSTHDADLRRDADIVLAEGALR
ncbi:ABC transporter ATP-binding protein [Aeromicrobium wangtongii]|uniref:ATP-binding cassette domain-containing protein n=1 Tax=Aeromicrobium wangtongii TaxID=2969247 RepID=A0ABY5M7U2_9ACTN|nr:ATP-binding cassette domain-containing protein [Aeromicrobium wangtongii]MCD9199915.1 ATP-binding cassette domain-containing protein [Aeromicrobium wangtongii]UUP13532.1 ATP-binding cassette domain-containing protein [Aeromicrobium wangtongii]